jgi:hypothetical protein
MGWEKAQVMWEEWSSVGCECWLVAEISARLLPAHQVMGAPAVYSPSGCIWSVPGPRITAGAPGQGCTGNSKLTLACPWPGAPAVILGPGQIGRA